MLGKIKRLLGIGQSSEDDGSSAETSVTVERERESDAGPDAASEAAAEGAEASDEGDESERAEPDESAEPEEPAADAGADTGAEGDEPVAADTDASGSTESIVDEEEATEDATARAEPSEAAGPETEDVTTDMDAVGPDADTEADEGVPVDDVKGIGPAYADRLSEIGIDSVADLADADAAEVAEGTAVSESRVQRWIDRAKEYDA